MAKQWGKRPPSRKLFRLLIDDQAGREVTCITDASAFLREAFRAGAKTVTVVKLKSIINGNAGRDQGQMDRSA
jgi:hypothetical protein